MASFVSVAEVKTALIIDVAEDRIQLAIDDAEDEALQYLNLDGGNLAEEIQQAQDLSDSGDGPRSYLAVRRAVILLVELYLDDKPPAAKIEQREAARRLLHPYRKAMGV